MSLLGLLARNRLALAGLVVMLIIIVLALVTPLLPLADPDVTNTANRFKRPLEDGTILGTDHLGRDLLSRLFWGSRLSLAVGFASALIAATIGSAIGIIAGFYGGRTDNVIMRGVDMLMAFPYILLALAIVAALGPGLVNALIAVAAVNVPFFARNIRGVTVGIAHREFVDAARLSGMGDARIILTEVLPNVVPVIVIAMSTTVGWMILETAGLSFLGLGSQPPQADLGSMLGEARSALITNPHTSVVPGAMILVIVMSINLLGDGIRDALDPRLRSGTLSRSMPSTLVRRKTPSPPAAGSSALLTLSDGVDAPSERRQDAPEKTPDQLRVKSTRRASMEHTTIIGIDISKRSFQLHGATAEGKPVFRKSLSRGKFLGFLSKVPPCLVVMEACGGAHHWGREIIAMGHACKLIPPVYVKPFVKRQKNDMNDAAATALAAQRPTMRFVAVKSEEAQADAMLFRTRALLVRQRTQTINSLRGHLAEFGMVAPRGTANVERLRQELAGAQEPPPEQVAEMAELLLAQIDALSEKITGLDKEIRTRARGREEMKRLMTIPGIGPICAMAVHAFAPPMASFRRGRDFASL